MAGGLAVAAVVAMAAWAAVTLLTPMPTSSVSRAVANTIPISQDGRIVAVTDTSVTTVGSDGVARTFMMTPDTAAVTTAGGSSGAAAAAFAVNDEVSIVGEVRNGTPVATAVAAQAVSNLNGPPMDFPAA